MISFDFSKDPTFLHADFIYDKSGFLLLVIGVGTATINTLHFFS